MIAPDGIAAEVASASTPYTMLGVARGLESWHPSSAAGARLQAPSTADPVYPRRHPRGGTAPISGPRQGGTGLEDDGHFAGTHPRHPRRGRIDLRAGAVEPLRRLWFFAYRIRIANEGDEVVQLVSRHWVITDANGEVEEVTGPGVVGEQPILAPGEAFEYSSFCPCRLPSAP